MSIQISGPCIPGDGSVTTAKINSGNAGDGQVLTADGAGGAAWEAAAGGGGAVAPYLGSDDYWEFAEVSSAYTSVTGNEPTQGAIAFFMNDGAAMLAIYDTAQGGRWYTVNMGGILS